jgi:hypothetical protein
MTTQDIAGQTRRLFSSTTKLLGLDETKLSVAEKIRVDRASTLRLLLDDMQSAQLSGGVIDVGQFIKASEELERLVGGNPDGTAMPDFSRAKEELNALLAGRAERLAAREKSESERLREENAKLREEIAQLQATSAERSADMPEPKPPTNVVPIKAHDANATRPPSHYLRDGQAREPWRDGGGVLIAPYVELPEDRRKP